MHTPASGSFLFNTRRGHDGLCDSRFKGPSLSEKHSMLESHQKQVYNVKKNRSYNNEQITSAASPGGLDTALLQVGLPWAIKVFV